LHAQKSQQFCIENIFISDGCYDDGCFANAQTFVTANLGKMINDQGVILDGYDA